MAEGPKQQMPARRKARKRALDVLYEADLRNRAPSTVLTDYVARYARAIQQQRGDYNGRVLSIRADDLRALAIVYDASPSGLIERLTEHGVLVADPRAFFAS